MARKGATNFTKQVTRELIQEQKKKIREEEKQAKQAQKELEKQQKEEYYNNMYKEAEKLTNDIFNYRKKLEDIIKDMSNNHISIEEFIKKDIVNLEIPNELLNPWEEPIKPYTKKSNILEKIFKSQREKYNKYIYDINTNYENEYKSYEDKEFNRKNKIELLAKEHELKSNEIIKIKKELYKNGETTILTSYKEELLNNLKYPFEFEKDINIGYCKDTKKLVIDYLLPDTKIVPKVKIYEYKKQKDKITSNYLNDKDINKIYNDVIFSIAINSTGTVFENDICDNISHVVFNGYTKAIDLATGKDIKPYIISTIIHKKTYNTLDLCKIDKLKCIKETMQGRININSNQELMNVIPICKLDYFNRSITSNDSINLLEVDPFVLEDLVVNLFTSMGYDVEGTKKTNDGGIDFRIKNNDMITGGNIIGQVKRYKSNIDIPKLREFESVLRNSNAMKGIFISTSKFSPQCERFASDNNIDLINGDEMVKLFNTYGISSYIQ